MFEQFKFYNDIFGFVFSIEKIRSLDDEKLKAYWLNLERWLKHNENSDIDGLNLFVELIILKEIMHVENNIPIIILNYVKRIDYFPNAYIVYRIMLTIHVSVASVKYSFSKLKLIKSYLRSTMSQ